MRSYTNVAFSLAALLLFAIPAQAQQSSGADQEYKAAMEKMQKDMMAGMDPDANKAWAKMMIPHHQGAVDMSKAVLKSTKDAKIREMADKTIKEQTKDIKDLQDWLKKNGA